MISEPLRSPRLTTPRYVTVSLSKIGFLRSSLPLHGVVTGGYPCLAPRSRAPTMRVARVCARMCMRVRVLWRTLVGSMTDVKVTVARAKVQGDGGGRPLFDFYLNLVPTSQEFVEAVPLRRYRK